ncbi:MAG: hypothetical protein KHZ62_03760 [Clostridiales bacterium]|nr:hypothetical protein [Clostridiales bacterium]
MKKIKEALMKDFGWKLLSLCIAIAMWFIVINSENPIESRSYTVNLTILNEQQIEENGYIISNLNELKNTKVTIRVRGQRMSLDHLSQSRNNITATTDFSKAVSSLGTDDSIDLSVDVKLPSSVGDNFEILSRSPSVIVLNAAQMIEGAYNVSLVTTGDVATGYVMSSPKLEPSSVTVSGPQESIDSIASIGATLDVTGISSDIDTNIQIFAYDRNGNVIPDLVLSSENVHVRIAVNKSKSVPVQVEQIGTPATGYTLENLTWDPQYVEIVGREEDLAKIRRIILPPVDIQNKTETVVTEYDLYSYLPDQTAIRNNTADKVKVTAIIEKEAEKTLEILSDQITMTGTLSENCMISFPDQTFELILSGRSDLMDEISAEKITGTIDITGLDEGTYHLPISFEIPEGLTQKTLDVVAEVIVTKTSSEPEPPTSENIPEEEIDSPSNDPNE